MPCKPSKFFCLKISYTTIATELDKFKERISGFIGILIAFSIYSLNVSSGQPFVSFPNNTNTSSNFE